MSQTPEQRLAAAEQSLDAMVALLAGKADRASSSEAILAVETQVNEFRSRLDKMRDQILTTATRMRQLTSQLAV